MELKDYFGHIITLSSIVWGGSVVVIRWLLQRRDEQIAALRTQLTDAVTALKTEHAKIEGAIGTAAARCDTTMTAAVAAAEARSIERMGNLAKDCGKDLVMGLQRLETLQIAHVEKMHVDIGTIKRQLDEARQDLRAAQRILGRYEVLNHGRTDEG